MDVVCPTGVTNNWPARRWRWPANRGWCWICPAVPDVSGRCWREKANRVIIGADNSESMIKTAMQSQPADVVKRVQPLHTSAFDIALPDNAVDSIFCMRLLHHIGEAEHRMAILREFERVTRDSVIVSLWVDGNFKAWKRKRAEKNRGKTRLPESLCVTGRYGRKGI